MAERRSRPWLHGTVRKRSRRHHHVDLPLEPPVVCDLHVARVGLLSNGSALAAMCAGGTVARPGMSKLDKELA